MLLITQEFVKSILDYNPETGIFVWKERNNVPSKWNGRWAGTRAGTISGRYETIRISACQFLSHHLAWLYVYGYMSEYIDHKDGNGYNNTLSNLREATQSQNMANKDTLCHGVEKHGRKFRARIWVDKIRIELGSFEIYDEAVTAYYQARIKYFGEFARVE